MAYRKQKHRVLTGGINLIPPPDEMRAEYSRIIEGFRVDQVGQLRTRKGMDLVSGTITGQVHSLFRWSPSTRYAGAGVNLYSGGALPNSLVATGFDGEPLGLGVQNNWLWIMNRSKQGKHDKTDYHNWTPAAPGSAPSPAAAAQQEASVATFDTGESWTITSPDGSSSAGTHDGTNAKTGQSLKVSCTERGIWQAKHVYSSPTDLSVGSSVKDEDYFRLWIYLSNAAALEDIKIAVDCNAGDFKSDYYQVTIPKNFLPVVSDGWYEIKIRREVSAGAILEGTAEVTAKAQQARAAGEDVRAEVLESQLRNTYAEYLDDIFGFNRIGNTAGKDWQTAKAVMVQVYVSQATDFYADVARFTGGATTSLHGAYTYYVTYDTDDGHESNPSAASSEVALDGQEMSLTSIPTATDSQVTKRHIYRIGGTLGQAYRVHTLDDNVATSWTDTISDETAQNSGLVLEADHDPAPAARGLIGPYYGKLIAYSSAAHPGRYWWTKTARPWYFPGADSDISGQWSDTGEDEDELLYATHHKRMILFYKRRAIWRLSGDPDYADPELTNAQVGTVGPKAVANAGDMDYYVGDEGIYRFNGDYVDDISADIKPLFLNDYGIASENIFVPPIAEAYKDQCVLEFSGGRLYFSYPEEGSTRPSITLVYDIATNRWYHHKLAASLGDGGFTALLNEGHQRGLLGATWNGSTSNLWGVERGAQDGSTAVPIRWLSGFMDMGLPDNEKVMADVVVDYQTAIGAGSAQTYTVSVLYNNGATEITLGTISSADRTKRRFPLGSNGEGYDATNIAIKITGNVAEAGIIYGVYVHYYPVARKALTFDTGSFALHSDGPGEILAVEVEAETTSDLTWRLSTDLPGGTMTVRTTETVTNALGRRTVRLPLSSAIEGHRARLTCESLTEFQIHSLRVKVRPLGDYIDGAAGEVWESLEVEYAI